MPKRVECVEQVVFNEIAYRRYPNSGNISDRRYFRCGYSDIVNGFSYLHRDKWKAQHGEIPEGHLIHHKDSDPSNNEIENLECISSATHSQRHPHSEEYLIQNKKHLARIRLLAKAWHQTEEGRAWHVELGKAAYAKRKLRQYIWMLCSR